MLAAGASTAHGPWAGQLPALAAGAAATERAVAACHAML